MQRIFIFILASLAMGTQVWAQAQSIDDQEVVDVESLYKAPPAAPVIETTPTADSAPATQSPVEDDIEVQAVQDAAVVTKSVKNEKVQKLNDLNKLAPFREISIIQKKYLPKTERFQLYIAPGMTTNSPWFLNLGVKVNAGYHFTETFGVELSGVFLSNSERQVAQEIRDNNRLEPEKFVNTKSYLGGDIFWAPIYGKISFLNDRIIPFDMYFTFGGGTSNTNSEEGNVPTFHVGTGQIFAMSKWMAFRWDYSWTHFSATSVSGVGGVPGSKNEYDDLILTAGFSFFFPEAKYR